MNLRGRVVTVGERREVSTTYGPRSVATVVLEDGAATRKASLWGPWAETVEYLETGMHCSLIDVVEDDGSLSTVEGSFVVVEPDAVVDVTAIRSWVQCPRLYYLNKLTGLPLKEAVVRGTIIHEVFGDLLRGRDLEASVEERVIDAGLELGLLDLDTASVRAAVTDHAKAIAGWLEQGTLTDPDSWRSEMTLISDTFGLKGRADAVRRGSPVELKTGKNTRREPRFHDKVQAACYGLMLADRKRTPGETLDVPDTGTLLYTRNAALDRAETDGDLSPAKDFSIGRGLLEYVVRARNHLVATERAGRVPTGYEADAVCEYCFEQDACLVVSGKLDQPSKAGAVGGPLPEPDRHAFERWYRAIETERRATHREFAKLWTQTSAERAADDRALIGLEPAGKRQLEGGRWELTATRDGRAVSKLREGDIALASDGDPINGRAEMVRIERLEAGEVVVTADEPLACTRLDVYPSDIGANRLLEALHDVVLRGNDRRRELLYRDGQPSFADWEEPVIPNNPAQDEAVRRALNAEDFALIQGPPGTGKTYTIGALVEAAVDRGERVLLSAYTNRAVDTVLEAVLERGVEDVVRIGTESGVGDHLHPYRLPRRGDPSVLATRLHESPVVAATTTSCGSRILRNETFDRAIVDEAAQLTEPATYAAIARADRFVLVGDHRQLPPVVRSEDDALSESLFERLIDRCPSAATMLDRQYRMAQRIQAFASREFYDDQLRPATHEVAAQHITDLKAVDGEKVPAHLRGRVTFLDAPGDGAAHRDRTEASIVSATVEAYREGGVPAAAIGVIAPYRAQVATVADRVPADVTVDTVDRFQGSSKEVILVSFVASEALDGPIFEDYRRLNVALTRAKKALVLIGTEEALRSDPVYDRMLEWATG